MSDQRTVHTLESSGQEVDVGKLVVGNGLQVLVEVGVVETGLSEVVGGEHVDTLVVESSLKVLQGQSVVEDGGIVNSALGKSGCRGGQAGQEGGTDDGGLHFGIGVRELFGVVVWLSIEVLSRELMRYKSPRGTVAVLIPGLKRLITISHVFA